MTSEEIQVDLGRGYVATANLHTFNRLRLGRFKWQPQVHPLGHVYAVTYIGSMVSMHRLLAGAKDGQHVDHRDRDTLNNLDSNLRLCTPGQNRANSRKTRKNSSGFKGVTWAANSRKWMAQIVVNGERIYLGLWVDKRRAAKAYDRAARKAHGEFAGVNFPDKEAQSVRVDRDRRLPVKPTQESRPVAHAQAMAKARRGEYGPVWIRGAAVRGIDGRVIEAVHHYIVVQKARSSGEQDNFPLSYRGKGFVLNDGSFVGQRAALRVALDNGQVSEPAVKKGARYFGSEELWTVT